MRSGWIVFLGMSIGVGMSLIGSRIAAGLTESESKDQAAVENRHTKSARESSAERPSYRRPELDPPIVWESDRLEAERADGAAPRVGAGPHHAEDPPPVEQQAAAHQVEHEARIATHDREARDRRWAPSAEAKLEASLHQLGKDKFKTVQVECRSTSCTAKVEWPTFGAARDGYADVLHIASGLNCEREILLPPPANPEASYQATFVLSGCLPQESNE